MKPLPQAFVQRIESIAGQQGQDWLKNLPDLRTVLISRWSLQDLQPVPDLSYNYLEYAASPEWGPVVLKIGLPDQELLGEIRALQTWNGGGTVRLFAADQDRGGLLLERILPGTPLTALESDSEATRIAGRLMVELWMNAPDGIEFQTAAGWCRGFDRYLERFPAGIGPLPAGLFDRAAGLTKELLARKDPDNCLLHGDLHHSNILQREDGSWVIIDPKGIIGEPAFEIGPLLYNPFPDLLQYPNLDRILDRRLSILEEITGVNKNRLAAWSFCRSVLSAIWQVEDHLDLYDRGVLIAKHLRKLL